VPKVLAVMATAGCCDDSGKRLYRTGLPGKSGVGGGNIAVSPGKFSIAGSANAFGGNPYAVKPR
jgi:glutaminase